MSEIFMRCVCGSTTTSVEQTEIEVVAFMCSDACKSIQEIRKAYAEMYEEIRQTYYPETNEDSYLNDSVYN